MQPQSLSDRVAPDRLYPGVFGDVSLSSPPSTVSKSKWYLQRTYTGKSLDENGGVGRADGWMRVMCVPCNLLNCCSSL